MTDWIIQHPGLAITLVYGSGLLSGFIGACVIALYLRQKD